MEEIEIYDSEASYTYMLRAPDRRHPGLRLDEDDVHPSYALHLYEAAGAASDDPGDNGVRYTLIPHARLEYMAARFGFATNEVDVILDTLLHLPPGKGSGPLAARGLAAKRVASALDRLPDPMDTSLAWKRRRQVLIDHASVTKEYMRNLFPASQEDRQGALDYRSAAIDLWEARLVELGEELPVEYQLGRNEQVPSDPLEPIVGGGPLDARRITARMARDEWLAMRAETAEQRAMADLRAPDMFAFSRSDPAQLAALVAEVEAEFNSGRTRGARALEAARTRRQTST